MDRLAEQAENPFQIKALLGPSREEPIMAVAVLLVAVKVLLSLPTPR
jgi:hypothetical protein